MRLRWVSLEHLLTRSRIPPLVTARHLASTSLSNRGQFLAMSARLFAHCWRLAASSAQEGSSSGHSPSSEDDEDEEDIEDTTRRDETLCICM